MAKYVGVISGTSVDGLDLALLNTRDGLAIEVCDTVSFPLSLQTQLRSFGRAQGDDIDDVWATHASLGDFIGNAVVGFLNRSGIPSSGVVAIGSHGQTIRHNPNHKDPYTLQIGDPSRIAAITGIDTVADFRSADIALGGQGAPLVPVFHDALFRRETKDVVVLNIGGIANVTCLFAGPTPRVSGFDTGPGNALLDAWISHTLGESFDRDGRWASSARHSDELLRALLKDAWYTESPPKSTGTHHLNLEYVQSHLQRFGSLEHPEVQSTLCLLTATTIANAVSQWGPPPCEVVVCGGGRHNGHLMRCLRELLVDYAIVAAEDRGVDGDGLEAAAFAYLAKLFFDRMPGNLPSVTGATRPTVLGGLYPAH